MENIETPLTKEELWLKERESLGAIVDSCGTEIEEGIKDTLVALRLLGFNTSSSCEGHTEELNSPYIHIEAPDEPKYRFADQIEIHKKLADKYQLPLEDIDLAINGGWGHDTRIKLFEEINQDFWNIMEKSEYLESNDWLEWNQNNHALDEKIKELLIEFYANKKEIRPEIKLGLSYIGPGHMPNLRSGAELEGNEKFNTNFSSQFKNEMEKRAWTIQYIKDAQKEMQDFTEFLKKKYFEEM